MTDADAMQHGAAFVSAHLRLFSREHGERATFQVCVGMCLGAAACVVAMCGKAKAVEVLLACSEDVQHVEVANHNCTVN
jgi:hypothetical protein